MNNNHYLKIWLIQFPDLSWKLSVKDKQILDTIDPLKYILHNLTSDEEVIAIVRHERPWGQYWIKRYPSLASLPPEDFAILDHLVPYDFTCEMTERNVRSVIEGTKKKNEEARDKDERMKAKIYYEQNKDKIVAEEKTRKRIDKSLSVSTFLGVASMTAGIVLKSDGHNPKIWVFLAMVFFSAWYFSVKKTMRINKTSVLPKQKNPPKEKLNPAAWSFIILYWISFIGFGIVLGALPVRIFASDTHLAYQTAMTGLLVSASSTILSFFSLLFYKED